MPTVFRSVDHPGGLPTAIVYSRALARPLGACVVPVMIGAAAAALQGLPAWGYLVWGLPSAVAAASVWTQFMLIKTPAEVHLRPGQAAVQSVHDVLYDHSPSWHPLYNVRLGRRYLDLSVGWRTYTCRAPRWPDFNRMQNTAEQAFTSRDSASSSMASM